MAIEATKKAIDPSLFFLHPSDNPGATVTTCLLNGDNYDIWEKAMVNALKAKNKLGFINGILTKPADDRPEASKWEACNSMLISWVFNSIEKSIQLSVAYLETAKVVWDDLRDRYSIGNAPRIHELKSEVASLRQQGTSVMVYYTKLKGMWDKLSSYSKVPTCTCGAVHEFLREKEEEKLHQFLMGLDDTPFGTIRSQILSMEPLPTVNKAYALITREERHRTIVRGQEERVETVTMAVQTAAMGRGPPPPGPRQRSRAKKSCLHCNKLGHEVSDCFELNGYPAWYKGKRGRERFDPAGGRGQ